MSWGIQNRCCYDRTIWTKIAPFLWVLLLQCATTASSRKVLNNGGLFRLKAVKPDSKYPTWLKAGLILQGGEPAFTEVIYPIDIFPALTDSAHLNDCAKSADQTLGIKTQFYQNLLYRGLQTIICFLSQVWLLESEKKSRVQRKFGWGFQMQKYLQHLPL